LAFIQPWSGQSGSPFFPQAAGTVAGPPVVVGRELDDAAGAAGATGATGVTDATDATDSERVSEPAD
jgi:hypothetical protein